MLGRPASTLIDGPAGPLEIVTEYPTGAPGTAWGVAVLAHPHPLMGGTLDNKVVQTLARAWLAQGWQVLRFNFRGVGQSGGAWAEGQGEVDDMLAVVAHALAQRSAQAPTGEPLAPLGLGGFSFGGYVAARVAHQLAHQTTHQPAAPSQRLGPLVLVSPATVSFSVPAVPQGTLVIEGEQDDVVPLPAILDWARPQGLPVTVVPGAGHFFHGQLATVKHLVQAHLRACSAP